MSTWRKTFLTGALALFALPACGGPSAEYETEEEAIATHEASLNGAHFNLNLIGVPKEKAAALTGGNGRRIFVRLEGSTTINLRQGEFQVIDANGTDGTASFQLPNPDPDGDGVTRYSVYARALGKPGGSSTTKPCLTDALGETYCSVEAMVLTRTKGGQRFTNVSRELLFVYADLDGDGDVERTPLFGDDASSFFWQYDNRGLKLAQLRFYEIPADVN